MLRIRWRKRAEKIKEDQSNLQRKTISIKARKILLDDMDKNYYQREDIIEHKIGG